MLERHPVVAALLADGLQRAQQDSEIGDWMRERMSLRAGSALENYSSWVLHPMWSISTRCFRIARNRH